MSTEVGQEDKNLLAFHLWHKRGCPQGDPGFDYYPAEWLLTRLLPCLAVKAALNPTQLAAEISAKLLESGVVAREVLVIIAVLDGAREYAQARYKEAEAISPNNGLYPEAEVNRKDREFYRACCEAMSLYRARILEKKAALSDNGGQGKGHPVDRREYEDACVATFANGRGESLCTAIAAAVHLCRTLSMLNDERNLSWPEQLHARIVIGGTVEAAVPCLLSAWRDEIAIDFESWKSLPDSYRDLFLAAGGRVGPGTRAVCSPE
jgi:hypothetical protein